MSKGKITFSVGGSIFCVQKLRASSSAIENNVNVVPLSVLLKTTMSAMENTVKGCLKRY